MPLMFHYFQNRPGQSPQEKKKWMKSSNICFNAQGTWVCFQNLGTVWEIKRTHRYFEVFLTNIKILEIEMHSIVEHAYHCLTISDTEITGLIIGAIRARHEFSICFGGWKPRFQIIFRSSSII